MVWVLWDIVLPLIASFLLGLLIGWMLWRWRRKRIDAEGLSELRRSASRYKADAERLEQSNIELSDRLQAASGAGGGDLANARKRIDMLTDELKSSRQEVAQLKSGAGDSESLSGDTTHLREEIEARDRMIATLRLSLDQFGESDQTSLLADVALRDRKISELEEQIAKLKA